MTSLSSSSNNYERNQFTDRFVDSCNFALEREVSAYRFVDGVIARITEQQEVEEIEDALARSRGPVQIHLRRALELLASRDQPDYRNSIKESISSVESLPKQHRDFHQTEMSLTRPRSGAIARIRKKGGLNFPIQINPATRRRYIGAYAKIGV